MNIPQHVAHILNKLRINQTHVFGVELNEKDIDEFLGTSNKYYQLVVTKKDNNLFLFDTRYPVKKRVAGTLLTVVAHCLDITRGTCIYKAPVISHNSAFIAVSIKASKVDCFEKYIIHLN